MGKEPLSLSDFLSLPRPHGDVVLELGDFTLQTVPEQSKTRHAWGGFFQQRQRLDG